MDHELEEFLAWVAEQRKRSTPSGLRYPREKRTWAADYTRRRMAAGASFREALKELTVSEPALRKWMATRNAHDKAPSRLRPITVKEDPAPEPVLELPTVMREPRALTVVTPRGFRIEGLDEASVVALVRELG